MADVIKRAPLGDAGLNENSVSQERTVEHSYELQGRAGSVIYRRMSKGDAIIGMILRVHKNPIRSASWGVELPDDATDDEKLAIELLNHTIFKGGKETFDCFLGRVLSCLEYGYSAFEKWWEAYDYQGTRYLKPCLGQRLQTSLENIWLKENVVRQFTIEKGMVDIPLSDFIFFTLNKQGDDLRGESILRNAYSAYKDKLIYRTYMGIGAQRSAGGVPTMTVPKGTKPDSKDYMAAESLLQGLLVHENAYMIFQEGWKFEILESKFDPDKLQKPIESANTEMAISVLAQFVLLGQQGNTGAFALSRDQSDFFLDGLQYVVSLVEETYHREVITPFIKYNFGEKIDPQRIKLKGTNLNKKAGQELATVLSTLKGGGFITATIDDEIALRKQLDMPELNEDDIEKRREAADKEDEAPESGKENMEDGPEDDLKEKEKAVKEAIKLAEPKIKARKEYLSSAIKEMSDFTTAQLLLIKDKLKADIEKVMNKGEIEISGLRAIEVSFSKYQKALEYKLAAFAEEGYEMARAQAKKSAVKLAEPDGLNPKRMKDKELRKYVENTALTTAETQALMMKNRAILAASNGPLRGFSVSQSMANVDRIIDEFISSQGVAASGSLLVVGTSNFGANQFNKEIEDQLWGYMFVAVDDDVTSDICHFYSGKTYSVNGAELTQVTPPLHPNCRSYLEPIYKSAEKPEKIDNAIAPPSIQKQRSVY